MPTTPLTLRPVGNDTNSALVTSGGVPIANARIDYILVSDAGVQSDVFDALDGHRVGLVTSVYTDAFGVHLANLWPNDRGVSVTQYVCRVNVAGFTDFRASVPSGSTVLSWVQFMAGGAPLTPAAIDAAALAMSVVTAQAALAAADVILTHADVVSTHADVVTTGVNATTATAQAGIATADVILTHADVVSTHADVVTTGVNATTATTQAGIATADVILTHADVVSTHADVVTTGVNATTATTQAGIATADVILTHADVVSTHADVVTANAAAATALSAAGTTTQYSTALAAIASQTSIVPAATVTGFNGSVVASFIYDTRRDSDSGAWRKRCQNTSWYNEITTATGTWLGSFATPLLAANSKTGNSVGDYFFNTTDGFFYSLATITGVPVSATAATGVQIYRGVRKEFPEIVAITAEAGRVIIWDLTDASVPMWMVFNGMSTGTYISLLGYAVGTRHITSLVAINGGMLNGVDTGGTGGWVNFISDTAYQISTLGILLVNGRVIDRNSTGLTFGATVSSGIVNTTINSIAVTVLPGSPIGPATGLPVPTIAVGTAGGVSEIQNDGTVTNSLSTVAAYGVSYDSLNRIHWNTTTDINCSPVAPRAASFTASTTSDIKLGSGAYGTSNLPIMPAITTATGKTVKNAIASSGGLTLTKIGQNIASTLQAAITNTYNSGWMNGDIRLAICADTVIGTVTNPATEADRSVNANPMTVFGTLTKSVVSAGSQLVAYSGFSAANYLEQAYSANLDFAGDFSISVWVNPTASQTGTILTRSPASLSGNAFALNIVAGVVQLGRSIAGAAWGNATFGYTPSALWTLLKLVKSSGVISLYANGIKKATTISDANSYVNTAAVFTVGVDYTHARFMGGSLALVRASATALSADQVAYIYETERKLFEPGAQCRIAGTSTAVTALDYDDQTSVHHVGTSWGVTEFQGLKAINSYAQAGVSAISTKSGYKLISGTAGSSIYKPSRLLAEELTRTYEQRKAFGSTLVPFEFDAVFTQVAFVLPKGYSAKAVYSAGALTREGATKTYTRSFDGFAETITFAVAPGAAIWVSILAVGIN